MPRLLYSVPLTPQQTTVDPRLHWRLLDTHRQVWLSLLWGYCSFLLGPDAHKILFVPSKSLFPQSCGNSVVKSHWPSKSNSLGVLSLTEIPKLGNLLWILELSQQFVGCLLSGSMVGLTHHIFQVCCSQSPCPHSRLLLTHAGDTQTLKNSSGSVSCGVPGF